VDQETGSSQIHNEQSLFYDVICRGKDRHNATFWCGSSAVLRRRAIESVGGVATDTVVEDTHTAMKMHQAGWSSVYHHEVLAVGLAPEEVRAFLTQRGRWARGCYQMLRKDNPLIARGLTLKQRLHYFSSVSHYLEGPQRIIASAVPALTLLTGIVPLAASPWLYLTVFLPQVVLVPIATATMGRGRYRFLEGDRFALVRMGAYTAAAAALRKRTVKFEVTPKGSGSRGASPLTAVWPQLALAALTILGIGYQTLAQLAGLPGRLSLFAYGVTLFWSLTGAGLIGMTVLWAIRVRHRRDIHRFPVTLDATYSTLAGMTELKRAVVFDLNPAGVGIRTREQLPLGQRLQLTLHLGHAPTVINGTIASARPRSRDGDYGAGIRFDKLEQPVQDDITQWCFAHPFGPDHPSHDTGHPAAEHEPLRHIA
jgi:cellulose synthase (UDP-forming)